MENASKALIMAAGILIGIIVASLFAYEMYSVTKIGEAYGRDIDQNAASEFNAKFLKYSGINLNAQDIVTIKGYIYEYNIQSPNQITIETKSIPSTTNLYSYLMSTTNTQEADSEFLSKILEEDNSYAIKCSFDLGSDGRVNKVIFKKV